jgi:tetratricopeptide (TPR) repeat protein
VLKALGRLDEALEAYETIINERPEEVIARTGRAEVLKALGRLDEALESYETIINDRPENIVAKSGRAEVLKALGRLDEALEAYETIISERPESMVAKTGYCGVLFGLGRYDNALKLLPDKIRSVDDWKGYHIRGMIMLKIGKPDEAIEIFEKGLKENPVSTSRAYFRSALAIARLKQGNFSDANILLENINETELRPKVNILRLHTFGELKMFPEAKAALYDYEKSKSNIDVSNFWVKKELELVGELKSRYVENFRFNKSNEWVIDRQIEIALAP